ncbi:membrane protein [Rhodopirellula maiorica SM1]|uniref:Membrane protein n=1 Tax=Rhodopirellula maiorica SM1 TaxID=1265738 RepID=M5S106_9BACT|nr:hypothetical protein [Rhodopirellula maiorica]EMI21327.1 membrane protein [Rhodopirellula maiorica SM1]
MNGLLEIVDSAPGLYLFAVAYLIYHVACSMRRQLSFISAWQDVFGLGTFMFLLLRRLVWLQPRSVSEVMDALFRAIAFGIVAFALAGVVGVTCMTVWRSIQRVQQEIQLRTDRWRLEKEKTRRAGDNAFSPPAPTAREVEQQRQRQEQRDAENKKREEDRQRRLDLKLQAELEMEFAADETRHRASPSKIHRELSRCNPFRSRPQQHGFQRDP